MARHVHRLSVEPEPPSPVLYVFFRCKSCERLALEKPLKNLSHIIADGGPRGYVECWAFPIPWHRSRKRVQDAVEIPFLAP